MMQLFPELNNGQLWNRYLRTSTIYTFQDLRNIIGTVLKDLCHYGKCTNILLQ